MNARKVSRTMNPNFTHNGHESVAIRHTPTIESHRRRMLAGLAALMMLSGPALGDAIVLQSRAWIAADADAVTVADIAALEGPTAEALGDVEVCKAELHVGQLTVSVEQLRRTLNQANVNWGVIALSGGTCDVRRLGASTVGSALENAASTDRQEDAAPLALPRASSYIEESTLRGAVARYLVERMRVPAERLELVFDPKDGDILGSTGAGLQYEIVPGASELSPRVPLSVTVLRRNRPVETHGITVDIRIETTVYTCTRYIASGERLEPNDVQQATLMLAPSPSSPLASVEAIAGQEARRRLVPGQVLRYGDLEAPLKVRRRDAVEVRVVRGSVLVRVKAQALEDGRVGDVIRVRHPDRRTEFRAIVEPNGELTKVDTTAPDEIRPAGG